MLLDESTSVYRSICESMTCGVMLIDGDGSVETFNPAAAAILGVDREAVLRRSFAEVFIGNEAFEELNEAVLAAVYEGVVGLQCVATVSVGGRAVPLAVDTSYLREPGAREGARRSVVAVFSDISELESLRVKEAALARQLEAKHGELREAYRGLETRNRELGELLRKVRAVRLAAAACGVLLAGGIGAWLWSETPAVLFGSTPTQAARADDGERFVVVEPARIALTITVPSVIDPLREVAVTSPIEGQVGAVHTAVGEHVIVGQPLLDLDVTEVRLQRRRAGGGLSQGESRRGRARQLGERRRGIQGEAGRDQGADRARGNQHQAGRGRVPGGGGAGACQAKGRRGARAAYAPARPGVGRAGPECRACQGARPPRGGPP